jgi:hypothetical protein
MKLQPLGSNQEPRYPTRDAHRPPRSTSWKHVAATVGASLALWLPACGTGVDDTPRMAGDVEAVRMAGEEAPVHMPNTDPAKPPPPPPQVDPDEVRPAGGMRPPAPPPPPPPPPQDPGPVRTAGLVPQPLPPTPPPGNANADPAKPPQAQTPPPPVRPDHPRLAGVPRRVEPD